MQIFAFLLGIAIGGVLVYLLDPQNGASRRALWRDKISKWMQTGTRKAQEVTDDLVNRAQDATSDTGSQPGGAAVDDATLTEQVRSQIGTVIANASAVSVAVKQGRVTLTGAASASDQQRLIAAVEKVPGVKTVISQLETKTSTTETPAAQ